MIQIANTSHLLVENVKTSDRAVVFGVFDQIFALFRRQKCIIISGQN